MGALGGNTQGDPDHLLFSPSPQCTCGIVTKQALGILNLNGQVNTYTGPTQVLAGCLLVNGTITTDGPNPNPPGTSSSTVYSGALLGGVGTIGGTADGRDVLIKTGGLLNPGRINTDGTRRTGVLTVNGDISFEAGSTFQVQILGLTAGTHYNQLAVRKKVQLTGDLTGVGGAQLDLVGGFAMGLGAAFRLLDNDGSDRIDTRFQDRSEGVCISVGAACD